MQQRFPHHDPTAFDALVRNYRAVVIQSCYRFFLNPEDALDVSQEVFVEIFQSLPDFRGECSLSTWIYRICVSKCLDELKKRRRQKRWGHMVNFGQKEVLDIPLVAPQSTDAKLLADEQLQQLYSALEQLSEAQRVAFTLQKMEGLSNAEIALIMNLSTSQIEQLVYKAKKKLQTLLHAPWRAN